MGGFHVKKLRLTKALTVCEYNEYIAITPIHSVLCLSQYVNIVSHISKSLAMQIFQ